MTVEAPPGTTIYDTAEALAQSVAAWVCRQAQASAGGPFAICLSGGSTPRQLYAVLAATGARHGFPWAQAHWFWGDERFVPPDDGASNYRMAHEAMFARVAIPAANIHPIPTLGVSAHDAAVTYEATLRQFYGGRQLASPQPLFDVTLLGIGEDGHTASLFPNQASLDERGRWVLDVKSPAGEPRITLTYPPLESSRHIVFLAAGQRKQGILARVWSGDRSLPAARVNSSGRVHWFLDRAADPAQGRADGQKPAGD
jgi:6-phosphogluconolactonase